jgi:SAM-dependent methyltransferase
MSEPLSTTGPATWDAWTVERWSTTIERGSQLWEHAIRIGMYARAHYSSPFFDRLIDATLDSIAPEVRTVVDLGCSVGGLANRIARWNDRDDRDVVGVDLDPLAIGVAATVSSTGGASIPITDGFSTTVDHVGAGESADVTWVCGDVLEPPLLANAFDLVLAVNLFDSVDDPSVAVGQASALVRPGGWMLAAHPGAWNANATPPDRWLAAGDWNDLYAAYGLQIADRHEPIDWVLERSSTSSHRFDVSATLLRRIG